MKKVILLIAVVVFTFLGSRSQVPDSFKYQAIVRDPGGSVIANQLVSLRISIIQNIISGPPVYVETHSKLTSQYGMVMLNIGTGEVENGDFSVIDWPGDLFFIKIEIDPSGGSSYVELGTSQLLSVPYSLHSQSSEGFRQMTEEQRDGLSNPEVGMSIFNTTTNALNFFDGIHWFAVAAECLPRASRADAGFDQSGITGAIAILDGNEAFSGTGEWQVKYGTGGHIKEPGNPKSEFYGIPNATYILSWVISNECGSNSDDVEISFGAFSCGYSMIDTRDNQVYNTVQIGNQCWMVENLNIGTLINGSVNMTNNGIIEKYCFNNLEDSCNVYGGLYRWEEMMDWASEESVQGICPTGWHIPSDGEWKVLEGTVDGLYEVGDPIWDNIENRGSDAGGNLKETGIKWTDGHWNYPNEGATDAFGFVALPAASRNTDGSFPGLTLYGRYWTSTETSGTAAYRRMMASDRADIHRSDPLKLFGMSVRCIKD